LVTFFIVPESLQNYVEGMRCSLKGGTSTFGNAGRIKFNLPSKMIDRGVLMNRDMSSTNCNVINGFRVHDTSSLDVDFGRRFLFFGASEVFGTGLRDDQIIPAQYQALFDDDSHSVTLNLGMGGVNFIDVVNRVLRFRLRSSDTVFLAVPYTSSLSHADTLVNLTETEMFDYSHPNDIGARKVAATLFGYLQDLKPPATCLTPETDATINRYLELYNAHMTACEALEFKNNRLKADLDYFQSARMNYVEGEMLVGSVAVNCNPITLGHEYLIDYARAKVDILFVLVISEDLSAVSFGDRFELVSKVCEDKPNVIVLRGGSFVCTEYIAPEYFVKDSSSSDGVDFSLESFYFGRFIGPALGVKKIFLGDEPNCNITKQYNEHMQETMPAYGIDLEIIPRINTSEGDVISASRVRQMIERKDFDELSKYVPSVCIPLIKSSKFKLRDKRIISKEAGWSEQDI